MLQVVYPVVDLARPGVEAYLDGAAHELLRLGRVQRQVQLLHQVADRGAVADLRQAWAAEGGCSAHR